MCRAIAAAVFNDASRHKVTPLTTQQRFTALLQSGEGGRADSNDPRPRWRAHHAQG